MNSRAFFHIISHKASVALGLLLSQLRQKTVTHTLLGEYSSNV